MAQHRDRNVAHIPFYKDETVMGRKVTVSFSLRLFVVAVVFFAVLFSWALLKVYNNDSELHKYVQEAHAERIAAQEKTRLEIDELACYIVADIPDKAAPIVPKFRHQYKCPPYGKDPNFNLFPHHTSKSKQHKVAATKTAHATSGGGSSPTATSHSWSGSGATPAAGPPAPASSSSPSPTPAAPAPARTPQPSPSPTPTLVHLPIPVPVPTVVSNPAVGVGGSTCTVRVATTCVVH